MEPRFFPRAQSLCFTPNRRFWGPTSADAVSGWGSAVSGGSLGLCPYKKKNDLENFDFFLSIELGFGGRVDFLAVKSVRNFQ